MDESTSPSEALRDNNKQQVSQTFQKDLLEFVSARIELASLEAKEASSYATKKTIQGVLIALCAFFSWSLFLAGLTGLLSPLIDGIIGESIPAWTIVLFVLSGLHGVAAYFFFTQLKKKPNTPLFELSREEFKHDKQWLKNNK